MADPVLNNVVRAQCIWQGLSGLPEDRYVTTWAFARTQGGTIGGETQANEVAERLREFWLDPAPPSAGAVASFLPIHVTSKGLEIRCYDLGDTPPRQPRVYEYAFTGGNGTQSLPQEVAVCLSFYANRNLPRQRGRVFIGPLTVSSLNAAGDPSVKENLRLALGRAANRLANAEGLGDNMDWGVLSQRDEQIRPVTAGWVDDAFDTIRGRGQAPSMRSLWGT